MNVPDLKAIKLIGFDIDGVMTDGRIVISDDGRETKFFHSRDGLGVSFLRKCGLEIAVVTGRRSQVVEHRMRDLGVTELHQGVKDKWAVFEEILKARGLRPEEAAFAGDDLVDLPVMIRCGLALAPANSAPEVLARAHFVSSLPAGLGAVRQMAEYILKGRGQWDEILAGYLN